MVYFTPFQEVINVSMQLANYCFMFIFDGPMQLFLLHNWNYQEKK